MLSHSFLSILLYLFFDIVQHIFSSVLDAGHSWEYYIYSIPMRYTVIDPFVISMICSVLTSQSSPNLSCNSLYNPLYRRQKSLYFLYFLSKNIFAPLYKILVTYAPRLSLKHSSNILVFLCSLLSLSKGI